MADSKTRIIDSPFRESSDLPQWYERLSFSSAGNHKDLLNVKFVGSGRDGGLSLGSRLSEAGHCDSWFGTPLEDIGGPPRRRRPRVGRCPNPGKKRLPPTTQPTAPEVGVAGLLVVPIPTPYDELTSLINRRHRDLEAASGERLAWRMIDDPRIHDDVYQRQRTPELEQADEASAIAFLEAIARIGTKERHIAREYWEVITHLRLQPHELPAVMIVALDPVNALARFRIDRRMFEDRRREQDLADFLVEGLSQQQLLRFTERGVFTRSSLQAIQGHLDSLELRIQQSASSPRPTLPGQFAPSISGQPTGTQGAQTVAVYAFAHSADNTCLPLSKVDYQLLVHDRDRYDIIIDALDRRRCFKRDSHASPHQGDRLTSAEFKMMRGYFATQAVHRPTRFYDGDSGDREAAAAKIFQTARQKVDIKRGDGSWLLFRAHTNPCGEPWSYEFAPPDDVRWLMIESPIEQGHAE